MQKTREPGGAATRTNVRQRSIEIGLHILDHQGSDALTLKRIAEEVGVRPPALHWHFRDRRALLEEIQMKALAGFEIETSPESWEEGVVDLSAQLFERIQPAAAVAGALGTGPVQGWTGMDVVTRRLRALLSQSGWSDELIDEVRDGILGVVAGFGLGSIGREDVDRTLQADQVAGVVRMILAGARGRDPDEG